MNGHVARFLRRWLRHSKLSGRSVKRAWMAVPRSERGQMRERLAKEMAG